MIKVNRKYAKGFFLGFSYISNIGFGVLDLLPNFFREIVFRTFLGRCGKNVMIDYKVYFRYMKNIEFGEGVAVNRGCEFFTSSHLGNKITVGNRVAISPNVKFYGAGHDYSLLTLPDVAGDIRVGDDCWIGANSVILHGALLGQGCVIAAGSVVVGEIPAYCVAAGVPAKVIKAREISKEK